MVRGGRGPSEDPSNGSSPPGGLPPRADAGPGVGVPWWPPQVQFGGRWILQGVTVAEAKAGSQVPGRLTTAFPIPPRVTPVLAWEHSVKPGDRSE